MKKTTHLHIRISHEEKAAIAKAAATEKQSVSAWIRGLIKKGVGK